MNIPITRRDVIKKGLAAAALMLISPKHTHAVMENERLRDIPGPKKKVIIIGAGLAGLATAYRLNQRRPDYEIVIVEARARPGGRVETLRDPFTSNLFAEAGAFWISETHTLVLEYIREYGLNLIQVAPPNKGLHYFFQKTNQSPQKLLAVSRPSGRAIVVDQNRPDPDEEDWPGLVDEEKKMGLYQIIGKYFCGNPELIDSTAPGWPPASTELQKYDDMNFLKFLQDPIMKRYPGQKAVPTGAIDLIRPWLGWWDDLDKISALAMIRDGHATRQMCGEPPPQWFTLKEGMQQLPESVARTLETKKIRILYNAAATAISQNDKCVTVAYKKKDGEERLEHGDFLVSAIPFSTLRNINLDSASFSAEMKDAITSLEYASIARVFLQFKKRIWDQDRFNGVIFTDLGRDPKAGLGNCGINIMDMTFTQDNPRGVLGAYIAGSLAKKVTGMREDQRESYFLDQLKVIYPRISEYYDGHHASKCWDEDQWARGAYPVFRPRKSPNNAGDLTRFSPILAGHEKRVYFAGDHISGRPGWMEGALRSGHRAAQMVLTHAASDPVPHPCPTT